MQDTKRVLEYLDSTVGREISEIEVFLSGFLIFWAMINWNSCAWQKLHTKGALLKNWPFAGGLETPEGLLSFASIIGMMPKTP